MAESKNNFLKSKMNKDMDNRLVPAGEYRDAVNLNTSRSEGSNVGTVENILGNKLPYITKLYGGNTNVITIGTLPDEKNNRIFWFVTNFTDTTAIPKAPYAGSICAILMHKEGEQTQPVVLVEGHFLNFSKNRLITGVNLVENLLFWTDGFNQPRRINVEAILNGERTYTIEEQLSISRYAPYLSPTIANLYKRNDSAVNGVNDYLLDKFVRLSYRYKFKDNEYSIVAPFTQILFVPRDNGKLSSTINTKIIHTALVSSMINDISLVKINIKMPSSDMPTYYHIVGIEILLKSSDSTAIKVVDYIDLTRSDFAINYTTSTAAGVPTSTFVYTYNGNKPYRTLPEDQYNRVYDNVPVKAFAQEAVGGRIVYGNYVQNKKLPLLNYSIDVDSKSISVAGNALISTTGVTATGTTAGTYPQHSLKQKRPYSVGVVLSDIFGRQSSVILPINSKDAFVYATYLNSATSINPIYTSETNLWNGTGLSISFNTPVIAADGSYSVAGSSYAISSPYSTKVKLLVCTGSVVSGNVLTLTSASSLLTAGITDGLIIGQYLRGKYTENTEILTLSQTVVGTTYTTTVTCKLPISSTDYTTPSSLFKYIIDINGWHSYKIVVKQAEQDYYNVYNMQGIAVQPAADATYKSYLSLHGDNINKIPRMSMDVNRDSGITVSKQKIYSKVTISNTSPYPSIQQSVTNKEAINILSVGTAVEYALYETVGALGTGSTINESIYESTKNHLQVEVYDPNREFGILPTSSPVTPLLTVYETKPIVSNLDIYWETSTSGLVEDLNYSLQIQGEAGSGEYSDQLEIPVSGLKFSTLDGASDSNSFSESLASLSYVPDLKVKYQLGNFTLTNIQIDKVYNGSNVELTTPTNYFEIVLDNGYYKVKLKQAYKYSGNANLVNQTFKFVILVTTTNPTPGKSGDIRYHKFGYGYDGEPGLTLNLTNSNPSFTDTSTDNNFVYTGHNSSASSQTIGATFNYAINGSSIVAPANANDLKYSIVSIERFADDGYAYGTNYNGSSSYPNWTGSLAVGTTLNTTNADYFDSVSTVGDPIKVFSVSKSSTSGRLLNLVPNARYKINLQVLDCDGLSGALSGNKTIIYDHNTVTIPTGTSGSVTTQQWTTKNANVSCYSDGTTINEVTDPTQWGTAKVGAWCYYNNDPSYGPIYGKLYNLYAVQGVASIESSTPTAGEVEARKSLAPSGYHVPNYSELELLTSYLGGSSVAGGKMKETGTTYWSPRNDYASNTSGLSIRPNGVRYEGFDGLGGSLGIRFGSINTNSYNWCAHLPYTSTFVPTSYYSWLLDGAQQVLYLPNPLSPRTNGLGVRFVKNSFPIVTTGTISSPSAYKRTFTNSIAIESGIRVIGCGVLWSSTSNNPTYGQAGTTATFSSFNFSSTGKYTFTTTTPTIGDLPHGTTVYFRAFGQTYDGFGYGNVISSVVAS